MAALSPAVRRWQQVPVCPAAGAAGAAGAGHRVLTCEIEYRPPPAVFSWLVGLPAAGARCRGATLKALGAAGYGTTPLRGEFLGAKLPLPSPVRKLPTPPSHAPSPSSSHTDSPRLLQGPFSRKHAWAPQEPQTAVLRHCSFRELRPGAQRKETTGRLPRGGHLEGGCT